MKKSACDHLSAEMQADCFIEARLAELSEYVIERNTLLKFPEVNLREILEEKLTKQPPTNHIGEYFKNYRGEEFVPPHPNYGHTLPPNAEIRLAKSSGHNYEGKDFL
jgi:hypothetical protein